jgi:lysozyme family protein
MDRNFARALSLVLKHEGGWSDHPSDPGGATMKGVTLENFRRFVKPGGTKDDLRRITDAQVAEVYRRFYWNAVKADQLPDGVDYAVFDFAVNSGPSRSAKYLQKIVGVSQDGVVGPQTLAAVKARSASEIIIRLCDDRMTFLRGLRTWSTFGKGWGRRVADVRAEALTMASVVPTSPPVPPAKVSPAPSSGGLVAVAVAAVAAASAAVAGWWENITSFIGGLF